MKVPHRIEFAWLPVVVVTLAGWVCGCASGSRRDESTPYDAIAARAVPPKYAAESPPKGDIEQTSHTVAQPPKPVRPPVPAPRPNIKGDSILLADVIASIREKYPLLESAFQARNIAAGEQLAASGAFDLQLKGASESGPLGFYETYRHRLGVEQPLYGGGSVFAGYRNGRGFFQPWYLERQTNDGGEFAAGVSLPLLRNRDIDPRRAELWRTTFGRRRVEPEIQSQLIEFIVFGSFAYWDWVAAGRNVDIAKSLLKLATDRQSGLEERVKKGDIARIVLTDNERLIVSRRAKLTDATQKLRQAAVKLSLFFRGSDGKPFVPPDSMLPRSFPDADRVDAEQLQKDIQRALENRPEIQVLNLLQRQLNVDLAQAGNLLQPSLDAVFAGSQDVGQPTSSKRDKSEFELEAGFYLNVPIQRRKARGKIQAVQGKMAQVSIKRRFAQDKIVTDVQAAYAGLTAAYQRIQQARRALELARTMEAAERVKFLAGDSDLLAVNLRESQTADAAATLVDALLQYFRARAAYRAALALDVVGPTP